MRLYTHAIEKGKEILDKDGSKAAAAREIFTMLQNEHRDVVSVPLDLTQSYLIKRFREILKKHHEGVRGKRHSANSQAMYQTGGKIDIDFLKTALKVWDMRNAEPNKQLWAIANDLKLAKGHLLKASEVEKKADAAVTDKKNVLAATASRYYRKAQRMIDDTANGKFPNQ
jgi:hypothetical protein